MSDDLEAFLKDIKADTRDTAQPAQPPTPPFYTNQSVKYIVLTGCAIVFITFLKYVVLEPTFNDEQFHNTLRDDGIPPSKTVDIVLGIIPITQKQPATGCIAAFGRNSELAHVELMDGLYEFTGPTVQTKIGWFPPESNKCK